MVQKKRVLMLVYKPKAMVVIWVMRTQEDSGCAVKNTSLCDPCTELWVDKQATYVWNEHRIGWGHLEKAHPNQSFH